ncbi:hypothetical protein PNOK_0671200 [Pyrrhoderma noxium]|uniref:Uncharacterized protein n=1 Tax=Pyrrhoderma noxium TaxID=2282107 RepID=A0A286UF43_9AGAM|nr:hypothetical protein PNOK_0671200 [Pyrrhoderma noxium]
MNTTVVLSLILSDGTKWTTIKKSFTDPKARVNALKGLDIFIKNNVSNRKCGSSNKECAECLLTARSADSKLAEALEAPTPEQIKAWKEVKNRERAETKFAECEARKVEKMRRKLVQDEEIVIHNAKKKQEEEQAQKTKIIREGVVQERRQARREPKPPRFVL